ncbi:Porin [Phytophthora palmivora]|uniref:Porin n=1 Tax=Phytophthora palmivora TaxID=4796 RepID=A0A2P4XVY2_9STRA|nr:Porin [Phytophthora palmivora]
MPRVLAYPQTYPERQFEKLYLHLSAEIGLVYFNGGDKNATNQVDYMDNNEEAHYFDVRADYSDSDLDIPMVPDMSHVRSSCICGSRETTAIGHRPKTSK